MGKFEKKSPATLPTSSEPAKTAKELAAGFTTVAQNLATMETAVVALQRGLAQQSLLLSETEEARRREADKYAYDQNAARQLVLDTQAKEDEEREAADAAAQKALREAQNELCELIGIPWQDGETGRKEVRVAFAAKLAAAEKTAEGKGRGMAQAEAEAAKRLDAATAKTASALLEQKNATLEAANKTLTEQNASLVAAQMKMIEQMKGLASEGLQAAGGVQGRGMSSLEAASQVGAGRDPRRG